MLRQLSAIHAEKTSRKWRISLRETQYLGPWAAATVYAAHLKGIELDQHGKVVLPTEPPKLQAFCIFSGMSQLFADGPKPEADHPDCETVPLERFSTDQEAASWDRSSRIVRLLRRHMDLDADSEDQVRTCVAEVVQNIVDHSRSSIGGVMCARYLESKAEVRVGIVDRGVGVLATLSKRFPSVKSSADALAKVIEGGHSSKSRPNNQGLGVSNLFSLVQNAAGRMMVCTGDAFAEIHGGASAPAIHQLECDFPGTAVFFALPVRAIDSPGGD